MKACSHYRFNVRRWAAQSGTYDMGCRERDPGLNRFTTRDMYDGALADMNLGVEPYTGNRYAVTGGNPTSGIEFDGHGWLNNTAVWTSPAAPARTGIVAGSHVQPGSRAVSPVHGESGRAAHGRLQGKLGQPYPGYSGDLSS
ncbi:hypothetical protein [Streptomyces sp. GESEQ-4]|uniref:hypothetical protein n=1 Tax=Streptomyces sp. GESEQ-4 TaxID=2812655 RepID=UPI001B337EBA|nr:hypothetical protein [Streptomyces sp. GESEQ-4]